MTDEQANGQIGHNAGNFEDMAQYIIRTENLDEELRKKKSAHAADCRPLHQDKKQIIKDAYSEMGVPGDAIRAVVSVRELRRREAELLNALKDDVRFFADNLLDTKALGQLGGTPLGDAAMVRDAQEQAAAASPPPPPAAENANPGA